MQTEHRAVQRRVIVRVAVGITVSIERNQVDGVAVQRSAVQERAAGYGRPRSMLEDYAN